ncbi:PAS-domain containing protein, partial [Methylobacterium organophilum]|nr:PAS-domain containing protein [Methylobacterium organophilum]
MADRALGDADLGALRLSVLRHHRAPGGPLLQQRVDGRWVQVNERKTNDGGVVAVYTDVTEIKRA